MINKLYVFIAFLICMNISFSQVVTVGNETNTGDHLPIALSYGYSYSQSLYLASEIGQSGTIYRITYKGNSSLGLTNSEDWVIYMGHTSQDEFTSNTWVSTNDMTQVYSSSVTEVDNNVVIELTTPFVYNGTDNLVIAVDENTDGYTFSGSFYSSDVTGMRSILYRNDSNNPDPTTITENTIGQNSIPNIDLDFNATACNIPTALAVTNIAGTSADLSWTAGGSETQWNIEYDVAGFTQGSGTTVNATATTQNITGLSAATNYEFYVRADCGSGSSSWAGPFAFTTACDVVSVMPFEENFDGITSGQPICWSVDGTTTSSSYHWSSYSGGYDGRGMRFNSYFNSNGNTSELNSPVLDITSLTTPQLRFYFKNPTGGDFEVLISTDGGTTFTSLEAGLTGQTDWILKSYDLSAHIDNDVVIQFKGTSNYGSGDAYIYLDQVMVIEAPSCEMPTNLAVANIMSATADLSWTAGGSETAWEVEYGVDGFTQGSGTATTSGATTLNVSGLTAQTDYEFYVRANCGGDYSAWAGPFDFTTACNVYTIPYNEGFESGYTHNTDVAGCLTQESISGSNEWTANNTLTTYNRAPRTGDWNAFLRYGNEDWMFIPIDLQGGTSYTVDVYARQDSSTPTHVTLGISYGSAANAAAMTEEILAPVAVANGDYQKISGNFTPATNGVYYVGLKGTLNSSPFYLSIDDIKIDLSPSCLQPINLTVSNITDTTADLGWTAENSETLWEVEYGVSGFTQGAGITVVDVPNPYDVTGLDANTTYDFYVRANCGSGDYSAWSGPFAFTTACAPVTAEYSQNFDGTTTPNLDACWTATIVGSTSSFAAIETTTFNSNSGANSVRIGNAGDTDGVYYLISPKFSDLDTAKRVHFQMYKNIGDDADGDVIEVGVITDLSDLSTYVNVHTFDIADFNEDAWKQMFVTFDSYTGGEGHVAVRYQPGTGTYNTFYLDDFVYDVAPTVVPDCASNLSEVANDVNCGNSGVTFSWDAATGAEGYKLSVGTTPGGSDVVNAQDLGDVLTYNLENTGVDTTYYWTLVSYNTVGDAAGCTEMSFTTNAVGCYCVPEATSSATYIDNFSTTDGFDNISNMGSGFTTGGYDNKYDTEAISVGPNTTFNFELELVGGTVGAAIWVDWNNDFEFNDADELVFETSSYQSGPITGAITVPNGMANGDYRMRVIIDYSDVSPGDNACAFNGTRGEAEDYKLTVDNSLSIGSVTINDLRVYPNPMEDQLIITAQQQADYIEVFNMLGQKVIQETATSQQHQIDVSSLETGAYFVKVHFAGYSKVFKVLKR